MNKLEIEKERKEMKRYLQGSIFILLITIGVLVAGMGYIKMTAKATYNNNTILFIEGNNETTTPLLVPSGIEQSQINISEKNELNIGKEKIKMSLRNNESLTEKILITNMENRSVKITINAENSKIPVKISNYSFELKPGEMETVYVEFNAENLEPGLYLGSIFIDNNFLMKEISIVAEIESTSAPNLKLEVPSEYNVVFPGDEIDTTSIISTNEKNNVTMEYFIINKKTHPILVAREETEVAGEIKFVKKIKVPKILNSGDYILYVKAHSGKNIAIESSEFRIALPPPSKDYPLEIGIILIGISGIIYVVFRYFIPKK